MEKLSKGIKASSQKTKDGDTQIPNPLQNTKWAWQKAHPLISNLLEDDGKDD
jgi:hypothetical protein